MIEECEGVILEVDSTLKDFSIECMVEDLVTVALVTGHMAFPTSLKRRQPESNWTRCVVCITLQSITKFIIFPRNIFVPGTFLFTLRTYGAFESLRLSVKSFTAEL